MPKVFETSNDELASAVCRKDAVEDPIAPKRKSWTSREDPRLLQCARDGGARSESIDPFGCRFVGREAAANAIRLRDEAVAVVAWLFRSLRLDAIIVEKGCENPNPGKL